MPVKPARASRSLLPKSRNWQRRTSKATEEISAQINAIQGASADSVAAIEEIATIMERVNEFTNSITEALEQQGAAD